MSVYKVGIIGARGLVGIELIKLFNNTNHILKLCASNSICETLMIDNLTFNLDVLDEHFFDDLQFVFFCADNSTSRKWIPYVLENTRCIAIDNSSEFRLSDKVPLIIPEVNSNIINFVMSENKACVIANPNCTTAILCMLLYPLTKITNIKRVDVSTYQAVSGAGKAGLSELDTQSKQYAADEDITCAAFNSQIFGNVFSHNTDIDDETGYNGEEMKVANETRKILNSDIEVSATCIRVPVLRAHSEVVKVEFIDDVYIHTIIDALSTFPGIRIIDDRVNNKFPEPLDASNKTEVLIGRIRPDLYGTKKDSIGITNKVYHFFISGDQLLKGAAWNAYQIFDCLITEKPKELGLS